MSAKIFDGETPWFNAKLPVKKCTIKDIASANVTPEKVADLFKEAAEAMERETERLGAQDHKRWAMEHFQQRGTVADRIAAAALELSNPAQVTARRINSAFAVLFDVAQHDSHHFDAALNALAAVWPRLLPPRPLRKFSAQYFATLPDDEARRNFVLVHWYVEDLLKRTYTQFLTLAELSLKDRLTNRREAWLSTCGRLLPRVAEGRAQLIALIVDKLGDPNKTMAHKAYHQLLDMLCESSTYQSVLLTELEKLALDNKNTTQKGRAYCVQVLAQFVFNKDEQKLALRVIEVYLALLRHQLAAGAADLASTTAIIVGLRRAFPYSGNNTFAVLEEHVDTIFALAATGPFLQRVHALSLVHQLFLKGWRTIEHRFFRALYASLLVPSAQLPHSSQLAGYFTLLFKSLRGDTQPVSTEGGGQNRVASFVHRMLQQCSFHNEAYVCSVLLMVGEFSRISPVVASLFNAATSGTRKQESKSARQQQGADDDNQNTNNDGSYDPKQRDPRFTNCVERHACFWQLSALSRHSHPSVARLAKSLLAGDVIGFDVHPLDDLTLIHFLDMITEGKTTEKKKPSTEGKGVPVFHRNQHVPVLPKASDAAFARVHPSAVDPAALFLHRFAHQRQRFMHSGAAEWHDFDETAQQLQLQLQKRREEEDESNVAGLFGPKPAVGDAQPAADKQLAKKQKQQLEEEEDEMVEFNWGSPENDDGYYDDDEDEDGRQQHQDRRRRYDDDDDDDDDFADGGGLPGFGGGENDDEFDFSDEDEPRGKAGRGAGSKGLSFTRGTGVDEFDEELQATDSKMTDRRRQRREEWLDRATGEGPRTPFNNSNKNKYGGGGGGGRGSRR